MEKNYKVSVIVTIYNRENYLCDCVCSLFMQTLDDIEFIFVDDASTDHSLKVLRDFVEKDPLRKPHVKIIPLVKNGGRARITSILINHFYKLKIFKIYLFTRRLKEINEYFIPKNINQHFSIISCHLSITKIYYIIYLLKISTISNPN